MLDMLHAAKEAVCMIQPTTAPGGHGRAAPSPGRGGRAAALSLARTLDELLDAVVGPPLLLVLDGITDPHNLGACLRVADGAGAHAVIAPGPRRRPERHRHEGRQRRGRDRALHHRHQPARTCAT
jgi:23S rRNA (guanosine2251-2'-O)-methyltransferase